MTLLKIIQSQALDLVLAEIIQPVTLHLTSPDSPDPELLAAITDLRRLCPLVSLCQQTDPLLAADTLIIVGDEDRGLWFNGPPLGMELAAFVSAVVVMGRRESGLPEVIKKRLADLTQPVHLEVFSTPT